MISKSTFVRYVACNLLAWLYFYKKEEAADDSAISKANMENGNLVGDLARSYFDNTVSCIRTKDTGEPIYDEQVRLTNVAIKNNANCIAEASFKYEDLFCAVDLLKKDDDGYSIYEVKSTKGIKEYQLYDIAFQKYVLEKCGLKINNIYIMYINEDYVFNGQLDVKQYFKIEKVDKENIVQNTLKDIENIIDRIRILIKNIKEPKHVFSKNCDGCSFYDYCRKDLPKPLLGTLAGVGDSYSSEYYNNGLYTIDDFINCKLDIKKPNANKVRNLQIDCYKNDKKEPIVDKKELSKFINGLRYPIYHLDFETTSYIIPCVNGFKPLETFPYQYSLHIEYEDGKIEHQEFLADKIDCCKDIAKSLVDNIPMNSQLLAYNVSVEKNLILYLAKKCPEYSEHLTNLANNFEDLLKPFRSGMYYDRKQNGSCSIKQVLPALCPHMEYAYKKLPLLHNGSDALVMFPIMIDKINTPDGEEIRKGMLKYCELDTLSMVEVLKVLKEKCKYTL